MKLLSIFPSLLRGGAEEYALTIAIAAIQQGWEVHAAFPDTEKTASLIQDFLTQGINYYPLDIAPIDEEKFKLFREHIPHFFRTLTLLSKLKPDVVHLIVPWPTWCFDSILACAYLKIPTLVVFQLFHRQFSYSRFRLKAYHWAFLQKQKLVAISDNNRSLVSQSFQISKEQIALIYNGARTESIEKTTEEILHLRSQVRQELELPENSKILLTVGRLHSQKGYRELVQVVQPIIAAFPDVKFVWIGEGDLRDYLVKHITKYNIRDDVYLLGYRTDIERYLLAADLFVFPTHFEGGQSLALSEAMAHNLPIIASDASGIPEVIDNKVHGVLFSSGDKQALLEAIFGALNHPEAMQEMSHKAKLRVQEFSEEKMVKQTLEELKRLVNKL